jgi:hypothetical protein
MIKLLYYIKNIMIRLLLDVYIVFITRSKNGRLGLT